MHLQLLRIYPLQHHQPTLTSDVKQLPHDESTKPFHDPDHAKLDETNVPDTNSDNGDDYYGT